MQWVKVPGWRGWSGVISALTKQLHSLPGLRELFCFQTFSSSESTPKNALLSHFHQAESSRADYIFQKHIPREQSWVKSRTIENPPQSDLNRRIVNAGSCEITSCRHYSLHLFLLPLVNDRPFVGTHIILPKLYNRGVSRTSLGEEVFSAGLLSSSRTLVLINHDSIPVVEFCNNSWTSGTAGYVLTPNTSFTPECQERGTIEYARSAKCRTFTPTEISECTKPVAENASSGSLSPKAGFQE